MLLHTSAGLTINENSDPDVALDLHDFFMKSVPENEPYFRHTLEGPDDLPAHIKSSIIGCQLTIPIANNQLKLGIWQGIYLGEFRNHGGSRKIMLTIQGNE
jgi:secondary thiamine-phosphate synthase enzyme